MSTVAACPAPSQFLALVQGRTDRAETETLLRHCLQCRACGQALALLPAPESLLHRVLETTGDEKTLTPECVERVRAIFGAAALQRTPVPGASHEGTLPEEEDKSVAEQWS